MRKLSGKFSLRRTLVLRKRNKGISRGGAEDAEKNSTSNSLKLRVLRLSA